jgi:hypothetical protein
MNLAKPRCDRLRHGVVFFHDNRSEQTLVTEAYYGVTNRTTSPVELPTVAGQPIVQLMQS